MVPSMRHFLRFIDADDKFDSFGFVEKVTFICLSSLFITESDESSTVPRSSLTPASEKDVSIILSASTCT